MSKIASHQVAVAWFRREDWDEIKRLCVDDLQDTFEEWLAAAEQGADDARRNGLFMQKVEVRPEHIRKRQASTGRKVDGKGRAMIAMKLAGNADDGAAKH
jgi:hypothetical protein